MGTIVNNFRYSDIKDGYSGWYCPFCHHYNMYEMQHAQQSLCGLCQTIYIRYGNSLEVYDSGPDVWDNGETLVYLG